MRTQTRSRKDFQEAKAHVSIMTDIEGKHVLDVTICKSESADKPFNTRTDKQKSCIEAISIDFWRLFIAGAKIYTLSRYRL